MYTTIESNAIARYPANPRADNPGVSFPANWSGGTVRGVEYVTVARVNAPAYDPLTQNLTELTPALIGGAWTQRWQVTAASAQEIADRAAAEAAAQAAKDAASPDLAALRDQAQGALADNAAYLAIGSPSNAQVVAQVRSLTQQTQQIIKALKLLAVRGIE